MKILTLVFSLAVTAVTLRAGPGHDHPVEPGSGGAAVDGPVVLTATQAANLQLETMEAEITEMGPVLEVPAIFVLPPERHARITAPFAGRVTELLAKLGEEVEKGQPLLRVAPLAVGSPPQEIRAPLEGVVFEQEAVIGLPFTPETTLMQTGDYRELLARGSFYQSPELTRVTTGQKAVLLLDVFPGERFEGLVQRVDPGHEEGSPFFHIYALVPNEGGKLHPNYRGRMLVETGAAETVVAVPRRAVLGQLGAKFVFVQTKPLHFERRGVVTGLVSGDRVEMVEGVLPGDLVVTNGHYQLQYAAAGGAGEAEAGHDHAH
ncbi:MAG: efflux RND transporter periplasmic adaptor subunit [Verrucomicrobia bacterium]|jgi:membrane fusion protein, heavy metal efflux system|nr:efflux RND transporter periplasmic adaptor subunit [Verrucomicrobiota bacterium]MDA1203745.1 efflux RND transporter periplasmic adaptor subunit [Verrucomicrobiota bacterium]